MQKNRCRPRGWLIVQAVWDARVLNHKEKMKKWEGIELAFYQGSLMSPLLSLIGKTKSISFYSLLFPGDFSLLIRHCSFSHFQERGHGLAGFGDLWCLFLEFASHLHSALQCHLVWLPFILHARFCTGFWLSALRWKWVWLLPWCKWMPKIVISILHCVSDHFAWMHSISADVFCFPFSFSLYLIILSFKPQAFSSLEITGKMSDKKKEGFLGQDSFNFLFLTRNAIIFLIKITVLHDCAWSYRRSRKVAL